MPHVLIADHTDQYLALLEQSQLRETQLEGEYLSGRATAEQLQELEQVRSVIEECQAALDHWGYFNPS